MSVTAALHRAVAANARGTAALEEAERFDWSELLARVSRLAAALITLGLVPGGRVAILSFNSRRFLECFFGVAWAGGVLVPVNHRLTPAEIAAILADAEPRLAIVDAHGGRLLAEAQALAGLRMPVVFAEEGPAPEGMLGYEALLAAAAPVPDAGRPNSDLAGLFYTGGTTGAPKGAMLSHGNLLANLPAAEDFAVDTIYMHATPMHHLGGVRYVVAVTAAGGAHAFLPRFDPAEARRLIARHRVTSTTLVPAMIHALVGGADGRGGDLASLVQLRYGGSPMPEATLAGAMALLPQCRFHQGYGMTETSSVGTVLGPECHTWEGPGRARLLSAGVPSPGVELRIADSGGAPLPDGSAAAAPAGSVGEILMRGPHVMLGYWRRPDLTAEAMRAGWFHTGDLGYLDRDGFLFVVDRLKDMIITNGENVYSVEVEQAILRLPTVAACAVFGIPHARWGEAVHAVVAPRPGATLTARDVLRHCRALLPGYKCPRSISVHSGPLPVNAGGKVQKAALRAPYWAGRPRQVN